MGNTILSKYNIIDACEISRTIDNFNRNPKNHDYKKEIKPIIDEYKKKYGKTPNLLLQSFLSSYIKKNNLQEKFEAKGFHYHGQKLNSYVWAAITKIDSSIKERKTSYYPQLYVLINIFGIHFGFDYGDQVNEQNQFVKVVKSTDSIKEAIVNLNQRREITAFKKVDHTYDYDYHDSIDFTSSNDVEKNWSRDRHLLNYYKINDLPNDIEKEIEHTLDKLLPSFLRINDVNDTTKAAIDAEFTTRKLRDDESSVVDKNVKTKRYWIYSPGHNAILWDEFYTKGIMAIGWDQLRGDLTQYPTKESIKTRLKEVYGENNSYVNITLALWQFANEIQPGDIVFVKKGLKTIVGRGIVKSEYIYDDEREEYRHIHEIEWTNKGKWEHPGQGQASVKTLTEVTPYTDYVQNLEDLFQDMEPEPSKIEPAPPNYPPYTKDDFLNDVFIDEEQYNTLVKLLKNKKNIILQGAPGVGKTFASKRLAYSIMGEIDKSRVMMIQFHQSYSYEDFIIGFRPSKDGFSLARGPFYEFCKKAQDDNERDYFFIIDEINRGNLSKIFGELLMLIERDKRGEELRLLYSNELFSVPKNVYIIGMMNTADRSLAMIDYALRRRFVFYELEPGFESNGFKKMLDIASNPKYNALVDTLKQLNILIGKDESLGNGFRIGHSYLCIKEPVTDEWVSSVIKYELIPLISEYWFDEQSKIEEWSKKLYETLND